MEHEQIHHEEEEYIEGDIAEIMRYHLESLGYKVDRLEDLPPPYYSYYFSGASRIVNSVCCIKIKDLEFDCVQILTRG